MFKAKFKEIFDEIFPTDGLINLKEGEDYISNNPDILDEEYLSPFGWKKFFNMKENDWLYACFQGKSTVYLIYLRVKYNKYLHFREKVREPLNENIDTKKLYYKLIECLTFMTLSHDENLKIVYNDGLLKINNEIKDSFFSDTISREKKNQEE